MKSRLKYWLVDVPLIVIVYSTIILFISSSIYRIINQNKEEPPKEIPIYNSFYTVMNSIPKEAKEITKHGCMFLKVTYTKPHIIYKLETGGHGINTIYYPLGNSTWVRIYPHDRDIQYVKNVDMKELITESLELIRTGNVNGKTCID